MFDPNMFDFDPDITIPDLSGMIPDLSGMILASLPDISGFAPKLDLVGSFLGTANITMPDLSLILETVSPLPDMSSFAPTLDLVGSMLVEQVSTLGHGGELGLESLRAQQLQGMG